MAPTVVLATNRGRSLVKGTQDVYSAHGVPVDLLDRCVWVFVLFCLTLVEDGELFPSDDDTV
jgi:DNA helicase TIP49 (TBP-interacting protein)